MDVASEVMRWSMMSSIANVLLSLVVGAVWIVVAVTSVRRVSAQATTLIVVSVVLGTVLTCVAPFANTGLAALVDRSHEPGVAMARMLSMWSVVSGLLHACVSAVLIAGVVRLARAHSAPDPRDPVVTE